jgi:hypothetical protein
VRRAGVDRQADAHTAQPQGVLDGAGQRLVRVLLVQERVVVVGLEDERDPSRELARPGLQEAERRRVGAAARLDGELEVIAGVVGRRIRGEAARRPMLESLVDRQDDQPAGSGQTAAVKQAHQVGQSTRTVASVPRDDFLHSFGHGRLLRG